MTATTAQAREAATLCKMTGTPVSVAMVNKLCNQLDEAKESINALTLALEVERDAANLYAKQVAHWVGKHDALLEQQLSTSVPAETHYKRGYGVALSEAEEAIDDECRERVVTASDCIELIRNLGAPKEPT